MNIPANFTKRFITVFLLLSSFLSVPASGQSTPDPSWKKIGPETAAVFTRELFSHSHPPNLLIKILVKTQNPLDFQLFKNEGLISGEVNCFGDYFSAVVSPDNMIKICRKPSVKSIYILDYSPAPSTIPPTPPVITGIIDQHMDEQSPTFLDENNGQTRVWFYWDQTRGGPGTEQNSRMLGLTRSNFFRQGHGWVTSMIAVGQVKLKDAYDQPLLKDFIPSSPIILVNTTGKVGDILDAVKYIRDKARLNHSRCIIFLPYSHHFGPHSGKEPFLQTLDAILDDQTLMIVSAGNDGDNKIHWQSNQQNLTAMTIPFKLEYSTHSIDPGKQKIKADLEFWFKNCKNLEIRLESPQKNVYGPIKMNEYRIFSTPDEGTIMLANSLSNGIEDYHGFIITIKNNPSHLPPPGTWHIHIKRGKPSQSSRISGWITGAHGCSLTFSHSQNFPTVSSLALANKILSVGSFDLKPDRQIGISYYSNFSYKDKQLLEPDVFIHGGIKTWNEELKTDLATYGTSAASALLTRLTLYLWEKYPHLNAPTLREILKGKAILLRDDHSSYHWNESFPVDIAGIDTLELEALARTPKNH